MFPPELPVTPSNMNYCIVAFGVILLIAGLTWVFDGRRHYTGPQIKLTGVVHHHGATGEGEVEVGGFVGAADLPPVQQLPRSSGSETKSKEVEGEGESEVQVEKRPSV